MKLKKNLMKALDSFSTKISNKKRLEIIYDLFKEDFQSSNFFVFEYNTKSKKYLRLYTQDKDDALLPDRSILDWVMEDYEIKPVKIDPIKYELNDLYFVLNVDKKIKYIVGFRIEENIMELSNQRLDEYKNDVFPLTVLFKNFYNYKRIEKNEIINKRGASLLKTILNYTILGYIILNNRKEIEIINLNAKTMLGLLDEEEHVGSNFLDILPKKMAKAMSFYLNKCEKVRALTNVNFNFVMPNGAEYFLGIDFMMIDDFMFNESGYLLFIKDLSLSRELEKLRELDQMKDDLISLISHELRTPITSIIAYSEVLLQEFSEDHFDNGDEFLKVIIDESHRLNKLITNILDISKIRKGKIVLDLSMVNLRKFLEERIEFYKMIFKNQNVNIYLNFLSEEEIEMNLDRDRMIQVFDNLTNNAIKYNDSAIKKIVFTVKETKSAIKISVKDNGKGISDKNKDRIFTYFFQGTSIMSHSEGLGVGLAVCKDLIEMHSGKIEVNSEEGFGSDFILTLPKFYEG